MFRIDKLALAHGIIVIFLPAACQNTRIVAEMLPAQETGVSDTPSDTPRETDIGADSDTDADTGEELDSETLTETDAPTETETQSDTEQEPPSDTDIQTDSDISSETATESGCGSPTSFQWNASPILISPPEGTIAIKDPTVVKYDDLWHIFATTRSDDWSMTYLSFSDWDEADDVPKTPVSVNSDLADYKAAPQLFYFADQELWYLVYQTQAPAYSTSEDPEDVTKWSPMTLFMDMPSNIEDSDVGGIDYWVICDDDDCYLFFSANNGVLYRARTAKIRFPYGFDDEPTQIALQEEEPLALFDASNVYKMAGTDPVQYLLLVSAIGSVGRYFRSWTAKQLDGAWTPLAATEDHAFASAENVTGADWFLDGINHGEMLRENPDETMTIDTCKMRYLFQGLTRRGADYDSNEYSLGLLTDAR